MGNITQQVVTNPDNSIAQTQTAVFDALSRLQKSIGAQNQTSQFGYDPNGNLTSAIDPKNHPASAYVYDSLDRIKQVTDAAGGVTQYAYNPLDQLTQVTAPNGATTNYTLDALGNRLQENSPDRGILTATYDAAGNRSSRTDARSVTASYSYDALNRLLSVGYPITPENISYSFDTGINCSYGLGRFAKSRTQPEQAASNTISWAISASTSAAKPGKPIRSITAMIASTASTPSPSRRP